MNPLKLENSINHNFNSPLVLALDFANEQQTLSFIRQLTPDSCQLKIGKELFTATGRKFVEKIINQGFNVFLDVKYHDIPNTVKNACLVAADMGVWMVNIHTLGGRKMMETTANALAQLKQKPLLIGVTILTSMAQPDLQEIGLQQPINEVVANLANLAYQSGLDGVVCSACETALLKQQISTDFVLVTPGIRLETDPQDDQKRIMSPKMALEAGSDYLVIGRPITQSKQPIEVINEINQIARQVQLK